MFNLFDSITKSIPTSPETITHIISYDIESYRLSPDIYSRIDAKIIKEYPTARKPLNTLWELNTIDSCDDIKNHIVPIFEGYGKLKVYQVNVLNTSKWDNPNSNKGIIKKPRS